MRITDHDGYCLTMRVNQTLYWTERVGELKDFFQATSDDAQAPAMQKKLAGLGLTIARRLNPSFRGERCETQGLAMESIKTAISAPLTGPLGVIIAKTVSETAQVVGASQTVRQVRTGEG